ncbi:hypothetical protein EG327_009692 [Venturia inaequalis]|uniref:Uncharacterized protein n=1 Tax=Venturia inaequalis TaxID=5025 RepID=A0A8H3ULT6_VENIN|nr:hypothetical protein EG327_009692 [Venturia inaequalis]
MTIPEETEEEKDVDEEEARKEEDEAARNEEEEGKDKEQQQKDEKESGKNEDEAEKDKEEEHSEEFYQEWLDILPPLNHSNAYDSGSDSDPEIGDEYKEGEERGTEEPAEESTTIKCDMFNLDDSDSESEAGTE